MLNTSFNQNALPIREGRYVIVGSRASNIRIAKDIDIICYKKDIEVDFPDNEYITHFYHNGIKVECLLADDQESLQIILEKNQKAGNILADLASCYILKAGHIYVPSERNWNKHIMDYSILRKMLLQSTKSFENLFYTNHTTVKQMVKLHRKCTKERMNLRNTPKLKKVSKEDFFNDSVKKYIDHDEIHKWMAHLEHPMFVYMQEPGSEVECSKELWDAFSYEDKIRCVLEECYVIASERKLFHRIVKGKELNSFEPFEIRGAFMWAIMRVCTTLCSGWFRKFAVDNYYEIVNAASNNYHLKIRVEELNTDYGK